MNWDLNLLFWICVSLAIGIVFACATFSIDPFAGWLYLVPEPESNLSPLTYT